MEDKYEIKVRITSGIAGDVCYSFRSDVHNRDPLYISALLAVLDAARRIKEDSTLILEVPRRK